MGSDLTTKQDAVAKARQRVVDIMREHSDDPRSQQLIHETLRVAEAELAAATRELAGHQPG